MLIRFHLLCHSHRTSTHSLFIRSPTKLPFAFKKVSSGLIEYNRFFHILHYLRTHHKSLSQLPLQKLRSLIIQVLSLDFLRVPFSCFSNDFPWRSLYFFFTRRHLFFLKNRRSWNKISHRLPKRTQALRRSISCLIRKDPSDLRANDGNSECSLFCLESKVDSLLGLGCSLQIISFAEFLQVVV